MKKILFLFTFFALVSPHFASAQTSEAIEDYQTQITIFKDSSIRVKETIVYDFGNNQRHGIYRNIPYKYKARGGNYTLRLANFTVFKNGQAEPFSKSRQNSEIQLKIGDADILVTGRQTYSIEYSVSRAINYFADHDELYWNAIGTGWEIPIQKASATVILPDNAKGQNLFCFTGIDQSTQTNCKITSQENTISFVTNDPLEPQEGLTIVAGLEKNILTEPTKLQKWLWIIQDNIILGLPLLVFTIMFWLWRKYGKDPKTKKPIVAQYEPPKNFSPLSTGILVDYSANNQDISAEIIYLATSGYIHINRLETKKLLIFTGVDYELKKLKEAGADMSTAGKVLFSSLFKDSETIKLSELKSNKKFGKEILEAKNKTTAELVAQGYFPRNPHTLRTVFIILGGIIAIWGTMVIASIFGLFGAGASIISAIIIIFFGALMPTRTAKGVSTRNHILGLKEYLSVAEKDRLAFHNAPEKNPALFEKLLPYAIALGVDKAWSKQFQDIYKTNPSWYSDSTGANFNAYAFSNSVGDFSSSLNSAIGTSTTASSGGSGSGGSSGGGFGGGGGGSW